MNLLVSIDSLQDLDLVLGKETGVKEDIQEGFVSYSTALGILWKLKGEFTSKLVAELPQMFKPAVLCQISQDIEFSCKYVAVKTNVHEERLVHLPKVISFVGEGAPKGAEMLNLRSKTQDV